MDNNHVGIGVYYSSDKNTITGNTITENYINGIIILSEYNIIYQNNFIDNKNNAFDEGNNLWDYGGIGNYWGDYKLNYPDAKKLWLKGIWDTPYDIPGGDNQDMYPLINKVKQKSKTIQTPFLSFLETFIQNHPHIFPMLRQIFGLQ